MKTFEVFRNGNQFVKSFSDEKKAVRYAAKQSLKGDYIEVWSDDHLLHYWN